MNKKLQSPGTCILLPGKLYKQNAWTKTNGINYQNKNTKGEKEGKTIIIRIIIKNNKNKRNLSCSILTIMHWSWLF